MNIHFLYLPIISDSYKILILALAPFLNHASVANINVDDDIYWPQGDGDDDDIYYANDNHDDDARIIILPIVIMITTTMKNDRRNSGGTLRQKIDLIDI